MQMPQRTLTWHISSRPLGMFARGADFWYYDVLNLGVAPTSFCPKQSCRVLRNLSMHRVEHHRRSVTFSITNARSHRLPWSRSTGQKT